MNRFALLVCFFTATALAQPTLPATGASTATAEVPHTAASQPSTQDEARPAAPPSTSRATPDVEKPAASPSTNAQVTPRDVRPAKAQETRDDARTSAAQGRSSRATQVGTESREEQRNACPDDFDDAEENPDERGVLSPLQLTVDGRPLTPGRIELHGLHWLTEAQVRTYIGAPPADAQDVLGGNELHLFLRRLARSGLFARVEPRVRVAEAPQPAVLEVHLEENPVVSAVEVNGLQDLQSTEILEELLRLPYRFPTKDENEDEESFTATLRVDSRRGTLSIVRPCPPRYPPRDWVGRLERGTLHPGILLGGVAHGLERTLKRLRDDGYMLASLSAVWSPDGKLVVTVDEGRLESVEVRGVDADIAARVQDALDLRPGTVFLRSDAKRAVQRLTSRLPFLEPADVEDSDGPRSQRAHIIETRAPDGTRAYHTQEAPRAKPRHREQVEFELNWRQFADWWDEVDSADSITLEGKKLVVHLRTRRPDFDVDLLPMHTQVTGFSPGLSGRLRLWDAKDRAHLTVDAALTIPLRWGGQYLPDDPEGTQRQRRLNMLGGAKLQVPRVGLAELGAQVYDFTDTLDRWRMGDIDSSLYSALINRPDRDYFRRKGLTAFATWRWADDWLAGVEYRSDRYESMRSFTPPFSLFRNDSAPFPNAPVTQGRFDSVVVRMEYASNVPAAASVGSLFRTPETSLFDRDGDWESRASLRGLLTLEVGNGPGSAGGDARFWKLVSDLALEVPTGWDTGLSLRVRTAGGHHLPEQKREALGGWTALRGFGFKEYRGDVSVLTSAEYRWSALGVFADLGTVRADDAWTDARLGLGASLHFGDNVRMDVAWRTDERATATPEARLLFQRTF
ncbi:hypothetical protein HV824_22015 [Myxococcus sp. AM009]|uniref:hypothetical protein n=1 Tax=unclassified Myxococcus TaxID=2648731 RepID=UPI0015953160|nr:MULTISPECIES: hypothetical protein [unclassified Myxococcus]NVJ00776.1 hypothetical protein [Myxococcus sp. AM009]NVJ16675.1 hypothetical protein [Myxococcus sp. AM010]